MPAQPETERDPKPFSRNAECKHPLAQLRASVQEQQRGQAAKVNFKCRSCEKIWNGATACLPIVHYAYQAEIRRMERVIIDLNTRIDDHVGARIDALIDERIGERIDARIAAHEENKN